MGAKIYCNVCDMLIKDVKLEEIGKITGKEICTACAKRIDSVFGQFAEVMKGFRESLERCHTEAQKEREAINKAFTAFKQKGERLLENAEKELKELKTHIAEQDDSKWKVKG